MFDSVTTLTLQKSSFFSTNVRYNEYYDSFSRYFTIIYYGLVRLPKNIKAIERNKCSVASKNNVNVLCLSACLPVCCRLFVGGFLDLGLGLGKVGQRFP